jgi:hypothetical protein
MIPAEPPLIFVEWVDSHTVTGWKKLSTLEENEPLRCVSVGWLIHDGEETKVIAPHLSRGSEQGNGIMVIPAGAILRTVIIPEP